MKRFQFPLETLLRLKIRQEDQARQSLILSQTALREAEAALDVLTGRHFILVKEFRELAVSRVSIRALQLFQAFLVRLQAEIEVQEKVVYHCREHVEMCRNQLVEARQNRRVVDKLKEKRLAAYRREYLREEQSFIDEVAGSQFRRQESGS